MVSRRLRLGSALRRATLLLGQDVLERGLDQRPSEAPAAVKLATAKLSSVLLDWKIPAVEARGPAVCKAGG